MPRYLCTTFTLAYYSISLIWTPKTFVFSLKWFFGAWNKNHQDQLSICLKSGVHLFIFRVRHFGYLHNITIKSYKFMDFLTYTQTYPQILWINLINNHLRNNRWKHENKRLKKPYSLRFAYSLGKIFGIYPQVIKNLGLICGGIYSIG